MSTGMQPLAGKVALVTGGTRGIGAAITRKLARWGCHVVANYVERDVPAQALLDELSAQGLTVTLAKADICDPDELQALFQRIRTDHGHLDLLIHNAAAAVFGQVLELDDRQWEFTFNANVRAWVNLARLSRPLMAGRRGRMIALSNSAAVSHNTRNGVFGAAKAAIESLVRSLAVELSADGILVNCLRPALTADTGVLDKRDDFKERVKQAAESSPWGRATTPDDVGNAVALLCLDEAQWISGQTIVIDGGRSQWH